MTTTKPAVADRPYVLTFEATDTSYLVTSDEVRRLVAEYPVVRCSASLLVLRADDGQHVSFRPATPGGGPAFTREES